jgi:hypothetical protein
VRRLCDYGIKGLQDYGITGLQDYRIKGLGGEGVELRKRTLN